MLDINSKIIIDNKEYEMVSKVGYGLRLFMPKKLTQEQFIQRVKEAVGDKYTIQNS